MRRHAATRLATATLLLAVAAPSVASADMLERRRASAFHFAATQRMAAYERVIAPAVAAAVEQKRAGLAPTVDYADLVALPTPEGPSPFASCPSTGPIWVDSHHVEFVQNPDFKANWLVDASRNLAPQIGHVTATLRRQECPRTALVSFRLVVSTAEHGGRGVESTATYPVRVEGYTARLIPTGDAR